ncbi:translation initiation factor IF-2-like [Vulpes lagopus]|uniref:translation initiation factor IF-2-like n=1 Tax=Vulpes lagopus TaxID=494514 RepID=UPI001BC8F9DB|nr:translation initiation factor IF-2-like [Vulpes lagopus]
MEAWAGEGAGPGGRALRGGGDCTGKVRRRGPRGASSGRPRAPSRGPAAAEAEAAEAAAEAAEAAAQRGAPRGAGAKRRGPGVRGGGAWSPAAPRAGCRLGAPGTGPAPRAVARRPEALAPASRSSRGPHSFTAPTAGAAACLSWPVRLPRHRPRLLPSRQSEGSCPGSAGKALVARGPASLVMSEGPEPGWLARFLPQGGSLCPSLPHAAGSPAAGVIPLYSKPHQPHTFSLAFCACLQ